MKSIDREYVCCHEFQVVEQKLQESNVKRRCITEHNGLTLFASMYGYCKLLISSTVSNKWQHCSEANKSVSCFNSSKISLKVLLFPHR